MNNTSVITPHPTAVEVPEELRELSSWLIWRFEQYEGEPKARKIPYWADGSRRHGQQGGSVDRARLTTFVAARDAAVRMGYDGVGFAPLPGCGYTFLDFDNCVDVDGSLPTEIEQIVGRTYAEYSPSGKGIRAALKGDLGNRKSKATEDQYGFETFSSSGFVTFTGNILPVSDLVVGPNYIAPAGDDVRNLCENRFRTSQPQVEADPEDFMLGREPRLGLSVEQMEELLSALDPDMGRDDWIRVGMALHHETDGDDTGFELWDEWSSDGAIYPGTQGLRTQWDSFERRAGQRRRQVTMASVIKMVKDKNPSAKGEWPTPSPLPEALLAVPRLTDDMLPKELAPWVSDIAERMSVPLDFVGIPAMVMLGALIGNKVLVRPEEFTDWSEPANLWGAIVAPPGAMKTPVVSQVFAPIKKLEVDAQSQNKAKLEKHQLDILVQKTARDAVLQTVKKKGETPSSADFEQVLMDCAVEPPKPKLKRFVTTDATVEKLGEICADNPNGVLYHRDELPTLFLDLQREEKAPVRGFMLTGWAGTEAYTFDRITRGTTHIETVNLSLFGTAQPQRIANLVSVSSAKHDDGMIQRLQLLAWPDFLTDWVPADRAPDVIARDAAFACCQRLSELDVTAVDAEVDRPGEAPFLRLNGAAREVFMEYRFGLEAKVRSRSLPEALAAHLAKYRGMVPRLALILHLAGGGRGRVTGEAMRVAVKWATYLEAHARRMYASIDMVTSDTAGLILRRIRNAELCDGFSQRDITQKGWSGLQDNNTVGQALATLQEHGWLRSLKTPTSGRPKEIFHINPAVLPTADSA
jgi:hypothetical protein